MRVASFVALLGQSLLLGLLGACADDHPPLPVPPPDQRSGISEELRVRVHLNDDALARDGLEKTRPALERTLAGISREYGDKSVAVPQSITETALMIVSEVDPSSALPYFARALDASDAVYGREHRETAFAVHDYGYAMVLASPGKYVPEAIPLLERSLAIRRRVLGPDAPEAAGSERTLSVQLLAKCLSQPQCAPDDPLLARAAQLSEHSLNVFRTELGENHPDTEEMMTAVDEIAQARGKPVVARPTKSIDPTSPATGCGRSSPTDKVDDLSWVRSDAKVYRLTSDGEFSVGGFDGRPWKQIGRHAFAPLMGSEMSPSSHLRWIAYSGTIPGKDSKEIWLFDARTEKERRVAIAPQFHLSSLEFSPDSATLAYFSNYDKRWTSTKGMGLYLVDTQTGQNFFAGYPTDTKIGPLLGFGSVYWSADGRSVLLHLVGHPNDIFTREFHRFDLSSRTFRRIEGNYDETKRDSKEFVEQGRTIAKFENDYPKTNAWFRESKSPAGNWFAHIDDKHRLLIAGGSSPERVVELGSYEDCEGETIGITGWVGDKYLVYRHQSRQFIFDPITARRAALFSREGLENTYTW